jgi:hypothetical protein
MEAIAMIVINLMAMAIYIPWLLKAEAEEEVC